MTDQSLSYGAPLASHPVEAHHVAAVIAIWNTSEHTLGALFALLTGTDPWHSGAILGALTSASAKIDLVNAAGQYTLADSARLEAFDQIVRSARSASRTRNILAHGIYATDEKGKLVLVRHGQDWFTTGTNRRPLGIAQLKQDLQQAQEFLECLTAFHNELAREMPIAPSPAWLYKCGQRRMASKAQQAVEVDGPAFGGPAP